MHARSRGPATNGPPPAARDRTVLVVVRCRSDGRPCSSPDQNRPSDPSALNPSHHFPFTPHSRLPHARRRRAKKNRTRARQPANDSGTPHVGEPSLTVPPPFPSLFPFRGVSFPLTHHAAGGPPARVMHPTAAGVGERRAFPHIFPLPSTVGDQRRAAPLWPPYRHVRAPAGGRTAMK
jgi:hypothetical protein